MKFEIGYTLSPLAQKYIEHERTQTMFRDPDRSCSPDVLQQLLEQHQLPVSPQILDFEKNLGGWCSSNPHAVTGYGVYLSLQQGVACSAAANKFRTSQWIFEGNREERDEEGEYSPLWGTGYPRAFFQDRALVPVGMLDWDEIFFLGTGGEVYDWISPLDKLVLEAGSGRTWIENTALRIQRRRNKWFEIHVCADVSEIARQVLSLPVYQPACDHLFTWWANDTTQICRMPDYAPCIQGTLIACQDEFDLQNVMLQIRDKRKGQRIRIWRNANLIDDWYAWDSLRRAGIDCEELSGPGPGHCNSIYDATLFDPTNWGLEKWQSMKGNWQKDKG